MARVGRQAAGSDLGRRRGRDARRPCDGRQRDPSQARQHLGSEPLGVRSTSRRFLPGRLGSSLRSVGSASLRLSIRCVSGRHPGQCFELGRPTAGLDRKRRAEFLSSSCEAARAVPASAAPPVTFWRKRNPASPADGQRKPRFKFHRRLLPALASGRNPNLTRTCCQPVGRRAVEPAPGGGPVLLPGEHRRHRRVIRAGSSQHPDNPFGDGGHRRREPRHRLGQSVAERWKHPHDASLVFVEVPPPKRLGREEP